MSKAVCFRVWHLVHYRARHLKSGTRSSCVLDTANGLRTYAGMCFLPSLRIATVASKLWLPRHAERQGRLTGRARRPDPCGSYLDIQQTARRRHSRWCALLSKRARRAVRTMRNWKFPPRTTMWAIVGALALVSVAGADTVKGELSF